MKDMNYPIDIIWLNENKKFVHIVENAEPSTYNEEHPSKSESFTPGELSRYVIEGISGTIERTGLKVGDTVTLPSGT